MKKFSVLVVLVASCILSASAAARAGAIPSPTAFTFKAGGSLEANASSPFGLALGADYIFHPSSLLEPFNASVYVDVLGKSAGGGIAIRNGGPLYAGEGIGYYSVSLSPSIACGGPPGAGCGPTTFTSSGFGGKLFGGFKIAPFTSVELGYHFLPQAGGYQTTTLSAELALRF